MPLTKRAQRRLTFLFLGLVAIALLVGIFRAVSQSVRDERAMVAKETGLAAIQEKDWRVALQDLSFAASRFPADVDVLLGLGKARSEVPTDFAGQNLNSSKQIFLKALEIIDQDPDADQEALRSCLEYLAELTAIRNTVLSTGELQNFAERLWSLNPRGDAAIPYLMLVSKRLGRWLPDDPELLVSGGESDAVWLERMRDEGDESVLRWALEALIQNPEDSQSQRDIINSLRVGGSEGLQEREFGEIRESISDVVRRRHSVRGELSAVGYIFLAEEAIERGDTSEAWQMLGEITAVEDMDSVSFIRFIELLDFIREPGARARVAEILDAEQERILSDASLSVQLAARYWFRGNDPSAQRLIRAAAENGKNADAEVLIMQLILGLLSDAEDNQLVAQRFAEQLVGMDRNTTTRQTLELLQAFVTECLKTPIDLDSLRATGERLGGGSAGIFAQILIGDALMRAQLPSLAARSYVAVVRGTAQNADPVRTRLIRALIDAEEVDEAFVTAFEFASRSQSLAGIASFVTTWRLLEETGTTPREIMPQFDIDLSRMEFVEELIESLPSDSQARSILLPELMLAAESEGRIDEVSVLVLEIMQSAETFDSLARILQALPLEFDGFDAGVARLKTLVETDPQAETVARIVGRRTIRSGDVAEGLEVFRNQFETASLQSESRLQLENALLLATKNDRFFLSGDDEAILLGSSSAATLRRLFEIGFVNGDQELAAAAMERMREVIPVGAPSRLKAEIRYFLRFDRDNGEACRKLIARADQLMTNGGGDMGFRSLYPRLLISAPKPETDAAIEVLSELRSNKMAKAADLSLLAELLQSKGRFSESQEVLEQIQSQGGGELGVAGLRIQARLAVSRGDFGLMIEALEKIASETQSPLDRLNLARALSRHGKDVRYEAEMKALLKVVDRPASIDFEWASSLARSGRVDAALAVIADAPGLADPDARRLASAQILVIAGDLDGAKEILESLASSDEGMLLLAEILLREDPTNWSMLEDVLGRLESNAELSTQLLRRVATMRLGEPRLRPGLERLRVRILRDEPRLSAVLELASQATSEAGEFEPSVEILRSARRLVEEQEEAIEACILATILHEKFLESAVPEQEFEDIVVAEEYLQRLLESMILRFPNRLRTHESLANHFARTGDLAAARDVAEELMRRTGMNPSLASIVNLARLENMLGKHDEVCKLLVTRQSELVEAARSGSGVGLGIVVQSLLEEGRYLEAWNLLEEFSRGGVSVDSGVELLRQASQCSPAAGLAVIREVLDRDDSVGRLESALACLAGIFARTQDPEIATAGRAISRRIVEDPASGPARRLQAEITATSFAGDASSLLFFRECAGILEGLPPSTQSLLRGQAGESVSTDAVLLGALVGLVNNFLASLGEISGSLSEEERSRYCGIATETLPWLLQIAGHIGDVQDSIASAAIACGKLEIAEESIEIAVATAPRNGRFLFTKARTLLALGSRQDAIEAAQTARWLISRDTSASDAILSSIDEFIAQNQE